MSSQNLIPENVAKAISDIRDFCSSNSVVTSVKISSPEQFAASGEIVKKLKAYDKECEANYRLVKDPIVKQGKEIDNFFRPVAQKITSCLTVLNTALYQYQKAAQEKERQAKLEADRIAAEEQAKLQAAADRAAEKAMVYAEQGKKALAEKWTGKSMETSLAAQNVVAAPVIPQAAPVVEGLQIRQTCKGKCTNKLELMKWAVNNGMVNLFDVNDAALNAQARACKGEMQIPGVEWVWSATTATKG